MKHLILSFGLATLAIALPGAIFFASRSGTREIYDSRRAFEERMQSLDERLGRVIERLERLERKDASFIPAAAPPVEVAASSPEAAEEPEQSGEGTREEQRLLAAVPVRCDPVFRTTPFSWKPESAWQVAGDVPWQSASRLRLQRHSPIQELSRGSGSRVARRRSAASRPPTPSTTTPTLHSSPA